MLSCRELAFNMGRKFAELAELTKFLSNANANRQAI
jgi:hypothetical protein